MKKLFFIILLLFFSFNSFAQDKKQEWVNLSMDILKKNNIIKIPDWVQYDSLISQRDYAIMLSKVTSIKDKSLFGDIDYESFDKPLSRALAIDSAIRAFGLEKQMDKVVENYKSKFIDISPEHKYYKACLTAEVIKLSAGYPDKTFRPDDLLRWAEAVAIIESVYRWASLMPEQTPIQKAEDMRKNLWYYFIDAFRLGLTLLYAIISIIVLIDSWNKARKEKSKLRPIIGTLCLSVIFLFIMWVNEMLYGRGIIDKPVYYIVSTISILAGIFLIRTSLLVNKETKPKPKFNVEVAYIEYVDLSRREIFVIDSVTKRRMIVTFDSDTKIYNRENRLLGKAFFSELKQGDFISIKGFEEVDGSSLIKAEMLLILASKNNNIVQNTSNTSNQTIQHNKIFNR
jgi:hypothetical protein